jgi:hypothetical protein
MTLLPTFIHCERDFGFEVFSFGRFERRGWRGASKVAWRRNPLLGEGVATLTGRVPTEARMRTFGIINHSLSPTKRRET